MDGFKINRQFWAAALTLLLTPLFLLGATSAPDDIYWDDRFDALGVNGTVLALAFDGSAFYVGGAFTDVGGVAANNIAKWDGAGWSTVGSGANNGVDGTVLAIAVISGKIYVGGSFTMAGEISASNIAKWDGSSWSALGSGVSGGDVRAIVGSGSDVYVGGVFTTAGGLSANYVAKWNGSAWSTLGSGGANGLNGPAYAMTSKDSLLYIGGSFTMAGGASANNIIAWNTANETWATLGSGVTLGAVNALQLNGANLFVGGTFTTAGGQSAKKIALWNGSAWSALGDGIGSGDVNTLALIGNDLYAAGSFATAGSVSAANIAKWNGSEWSALGSGIAGGIVFASAATTDNLYLGGSFTSAGGHVSNHFAHWTALSGTVPVELVAFNAKLTANEIELNWATATETNNFGFDIERQTSSNTATSAWEKIGFVKGYGTTVEPKSYSFKDDVRALAGAAAVRYRLKQLDLDGAFEYSKVVEINLTAGLTSFSLAQNYPNPFNPTTTIEFTIPAITQTSLKVYNMLGQEVATLVNQSLIAGQYQVQFDGSALTNGMYVYVLRTSNPALVEKRTMLLTK
jgi:hypothetical protein